MKGFIAVLLGLSILFGAGVAITKVYYVSPGNVGVLIEKGGQTAKGVADTPLQPGWGFRKLFTEDVVEYPTFLQTAVWTKVTSEGNPSDESITANSREGLAVNLDTSISYTLEAAKVPDLYVKFRQEISSIQNSYVRQAVRQAIQDTFGSYSAEEIYGLKKQEIITKIQGQLVDKLKGDGFNIQQFTINEIRLPQSIVDSINQKIAAQQQSLKAEQDLKRIKIEAEQRVAQAESEAKAIKLQSEAANNEKYVALKELEVRAEAVKKWNGALPAQMIPGTAVPFLNLK